MITQPISSSSCCARLIMVTSLHFSSLYRSFSASRAFSTSVPHRSPRSTKMFVRPASSCTPCLFIPSQSQFITSFTDNLKRGILTSSFLSDICTRFQSQTPFAVAFETINEAIFIVYSSNDEGKREGSRNHLFLLCNAILSTIEAFTDKELRIFSFTVSSPIKYKIAQSSYFTT